MSVFFEKISEVLKKQKFSEYMDEYPIKVRKQPNFAPSAKIVQATSEHSLNDGIFQYPCQFLNPAEKGAYLLMSGWVFDLKSLKIRVNKWLRLSCGGYEMPYLKKWDVQKIRNEINQIMDVEEGEDFLQLYHPNESIPCPQLEPFSYSTMQKMLSNPNTEEDDHRKISGLSFMKSKAKD